MLSIKNFTKLTEIRKDLCLPERIRLRLQAENLAISVLDSIIPGQLEKKHLENILKLLNYDYYNSTVHYNRFDKTFLGRNYVDIINEDIKTINEAFTALYWNEDLTQSSKIISEIRGANIGFVSCILYLKNRQKYNVYLDRFETAIKNLGISFNPSDNEFKTKYLEYNKVINEFKEKYRINPQEIDIILTKVSYW